MVKKQALNSFKRTTAIILLLSFILCATSFMLAEKLAEYELDNARKDVSIRASSLVQGIEETITRVFSQGDTILRFVKSEWESHGYVTADHLDTLESFLQIGIINQIAVADANGNLVFSAVPLSEPVNIYDREQFQAQIAADNGLYITAPRISRSTGTYSIFLSRRLSDSEGRFAGIVSVGLDRSYFNRAFYNMGLEEANAIILLRTDGTFMARVPEVDEQTAGAFKTHPIWEFVQKGIRSGVYESPGVVDGIARIGAFKLLPDYPLVGMISFQKDAAYKAAIARSTAYKQWAGAFSALMILAFSAVWWQLYRRYKVEMELRTKERDLKYISYHDQGTGIFNRTYFYKRLKSLSSAEIKYAAIIAFDLDGLKMVNDTFGHEAGDRMISTAANVLADSVPPGATVARIGGDEFAALMTNMDQEAVEMVILRIRRKLEGCNCGVNGANIPIQLSMGFAAANGKQVVPEKLMADADKWMYREKLLQASSRRSQIISTLTEMLAARDYITEGHAARVQEMVVALARGAGIEPSKFPDLELFAHFHDIGKVGIPDKILNKPGSLNDSEYQEMKTHSEIGHRIARVAEDLRPIADWILKHHERWDGKGYPLGLSGKEIPIECRILSIADSYDAITHDRPYRKAKSKKEAFAEIRKNSGSQFDPELVEQFEKMVFSDER